MAISAAKVHTGIPGSLRQTVTDVTFDSSYPTGGEPVAASDLGLTNVLFAFCNVKTIGGTVNVANAIYDEVNDKIKIYDETPAEAANTADLSTLVIRVLAFGY